MPSPMQPSIITNKLTEGAGKKLKVVTQNIDSSLHETAGWVTHGSADIITVQVALFMIWRPSMLSEGPVPDPGKV